MADVIINDEHLTDIADALRSKLGETKQVIGSEALVKISKTSNATGFSTYSGGYGNNKAIFDTVTIEGAVRLEIKMAYQTESTNYDWIQVMTGSTTTPSGTKYGGTARNETTLTINSDTVTFYFRSDTSSDAYLGYYAEIRGFDNNNQPILGYIDVPNTFKPREMAGAIDELTKPTGTLNITSVGTHDVTNYASALVSISGLKQVKTGNFYLSSTSNTPLQPLTVKSITGLGFQPTGVIVFRIDTSSGDNITSFRSTGKYEVSLVYNTSESVGCYGLLESSTSSTAYTYIYHDGRAAYINFDEDGFTLGIDGSRINASFSFSSGTYAYIAIG